MSLRDIKNILSFLLGSSQSELLHIFHHHSEQTIYLYMHERLEMPLRNRSKSILKFVISNLHVWVIHWCWWEISFYKLSTWIFKVHWWASSTSTLLYFRYIFWEIIQLTKFSTRRYPNLRLSSFTKVMKFI